MSRHAESDALHVRVQRFIDEGGGPFDELACDIARFQARFVPPVARLWRARGVVDVTSAADIPAVACDAFRWRRIAAHEPAEDARCFATSGTTASPGLHPMRRLDTYRAAAIGWGRALLFPVARSLALVALTSDEEHAPQSSLTFMLARFAEELGGDASFHYRGGSLDVDGVVRRAAEGPALVAGTSFAFVALLDGLGGRNVPLAAGSVVMVTGGFKGRSREVEPEVLRTTLAATFHVKDVIGEYGMTELSSQLYQRGAGSPYHPPPWLRVTAVDPQTLAPTVARGLAHIVDLANVDSAVAILTADMVTVQSDGSILLHGRAPGATPRGCALALEHLLGSDGTAEDER